MDHTVINAFISACFVLILTGFGYFAKRWIEHVDSLQSSIDELRMSIMGLSEKYVTRAQCQQDMAASRVNIDRCIAKKCPIVGGE